MNTIESKKTLTSKDFQVEIVEGSKLRLRTENGAYKIFDIAEVLNINPDDITTEYIRQAALYGYFTVLAARAEDAAGRADSKKEQEYAQADLDIRDEAERNGKKTTETQIRSQVLIDVSYDKMVNASFVTKLDHKLLKAIVAALEMKANMLISLGAMIRNEMSMTGMTMKENQLKAATDEVKKVLDARKRV